MTTAWPAEVLGWWLTGEEGVKRPHRQSHRHATHVPDLLQTCLSLGRGDAMAPP